MNIELAENSIKAKLIADFTALATPTDIIVDLLPENEKDYKKATEHTRVYVCYAASNFAKPKSTNFVVQEEDANLQIVIMGGKLRGAGGIYDAFRLVSNSLLGFEPTNCRRIYALKFEHEKREDSVFSYIYTLACGSELVQDFTEPITQTIQTITNTPSDPNFDGNYTPNS